MEVIAFEQQQYGTMLYVVANDGRKVAHAIPFGVLESRQAEWDLPDDIDPLDVVLVDAHLTPDIDFDCFADDYEDLRVKVLDKVRQHSKDIIWNATEGDFNDKNSGKRKVTKADIRKACELLPGLSEDYRDHVKDMVVEGRSKRTTIFSPMQRMAEDLKNQREAAAGHRRMQEEREAAQMAEGLPKYSRKQPRSLDAAGNYLGTPGLNVNFK